MTPNPLSHIALFAPVLLPLLLIVMRAPFLFGYAKPVPVNYYNLNHPKRDMVWVALAGPMMNLLLALGGVLVIKVVLAVFTAFPTPPLDGGRVLVGLLPEPHASTLARVEPYGFLIILLLLMTDGVGGLV